MQFLYRLCLCIWPQIFKLTRRHLGCQFQLIPHTTLQVDLLVPLAAFPLVEVAGKCFRARSLMCVSITSNRTAKRAFRSLDRTCGRVGPHSGPEKLVDVAVGVLVQYAVSH